MVEAPEPRRFHSMHFVVKYVAQPLAQPVALARSRATFALAISRASDLVCDRLLGRRRAHRGRTAGGDAPFSRRVQRRIASQHDVAACTGRGGGGRVRAHRLATKLSARVARRTKPLGHRYRLGVLVVLDLVDGRMLLSRIQNNRLVDLAADHRGRSILAANFFRHRRTVGGAKNPSRQSSPNRPNWASHSTRKMKNCCSNSIASRTSRDKKSSTAR